LNFSSWHLVWMSVFNVWYPAVFAAYVPSLKTSVLDRDHVKPWLIAACKKQLTSGISVGSKQRSF
jgi:hypothetical protein